PAELRDRSGRAVDVRPPFERATVARQQRHVELRLDIARSVAFEIEIHVPGHRGDCPLKKGVRVVQEAGMTWMFERREAAARDRRAIDGKHPDASLAEI